MNLTGNAIRRGANPRTARHDSRTRHALEYAIIICVIALLVVAGDTTLARDPIELPSAVTPVVISHADSLWSLAREYPLEGRPTAHTVEVIRAMNGISGSVIHVGHVLLVPAETRANTLVAASDAERTRQ